MKIELWPYKTLEKEGYRIVRCTVHLNCKNSSHEADGVVNDPVYLQDPTGNTSTHSYTYMDDMATTLARAQSRQGP